MTRIAIAKGRIIKEVADLFDRCGIDTTELRADSRSLIRPLADGLEAMIVRSQDVPLFVERGACALGITGYDTLREKEANVFELLDLGIATCRMCVCGPRGLDLQEDPTRHWRVATKYPRITARAFEARGRYYEIVPVSGAMETAPESGIADCIVDLVDTGGTLKAHDLVVYDEILPVSSRLIASKIGFFREQAQLKPLLDSLAAEVN